MVEENLIREFIAEADEYLFLLEPNLLRLEKDPHNTELLDEIFLATHSIKGTASYVGLSHISSFTHSLESLLDRLRKGEVQVSPQLVDVLLQGLDTLKILINRVSLGKPPPDTSVIVEKLAQCQPDETNNPKENVQSNEGNGSEAQDIPESHSYSNMSFEIRSMEPVLSGAEGIDPEDAEIFADIANQQIEFMHLVLDSILESLKNDDTSQEQTNYKISSLIKAFRKIRSSATLLNVETLDAIFEEHASFFSELEDPEHIMNEHDMSHIAEILEILEYMTKAISEYSEEEPATVAVEQEQQEPFPPSFSLSSPSLDMSHTLRVNAERVDYLLNLVGELVINRARLVQISQEMKTIYEDLRTGDTDLNATSPVQKKRNTRLFKRLKERFDEIILDLERLTNQMQEGTMRIRMVPIGQVIGRFPRMVRDLSRQAGKDVNVRIFGAETELDKTVVDILADPLIHIIRNAIDHGIEDPEVRVKQGKPAQGTITLSAYHEGNQVIIEIEDDGKGIDVQGVKQKALQQGIIHSKEVDSLQDLELANLIFLGGFSTVETVSSLSGRGVGLNVVKRYLEKINGSIELETLSGKGSKFTIKLPLTLAIIPALMVGVRTEVFAIPLISVEEAIRILLEDIKTIESHKVIHLRDQMIPLFGLADLLGITMLDDRNAVDETWKHDDSISRLTESGMRISTSRNQGGDHDKFYGVIISDGFREIGLLVDSLLGESDIVIKSLNDDLVNVKGFSGASIQGDGQVSLVIDVGSLIDLAIEHLRHEHRSRGKSEIRNNRNGIME